MIAKGLIYNARIHTLADDLMVDSMAVRKNRIEAVGHNLQHEGEFRSYAKINLRGRAVLPGFVDAHTHFYDFALSLGRGSLHGVLSLESGLKRIKDYWRQLAKDEWVVGEG